LRFFENIKLENFRNFNNYYLSFNQKCNVFYGLNGSGKTNILEAISLFEKGRGIRKDRYENMINKNQNSNFFKVISTFVSANNKIDLELKSELKDNRYKKIIKVNKSISIENYNYFENLFSLIWFLPEMERIFLQSPSVRRNFLDRLVYNTDKSYVKLLRKYNNRIIERKNLLYKEKPDAEWINKIEFDIVDLGILIYKKREEYINSLNNELKNLNLTKENFFKIKLNIKDSFINKIDNKDNLEDMYFKQLSHNRNEDMISGGCKIGPHRSDILGRDLIKNFSLDLFSTGQQKTFILQIILAHCNILIKSFNLQPIVFFDEVCSHLDDKNRAILLELIETLNVQIFLTGTDNNSFSFLSTNANYCCIE
tara:strand:+ start:24192 stop:25295 length:1104 start_codon:yes stop_codon:yes gene_type:complete